MTDPQSIADPVGTKGEGADPSPILLTGSEGAERGAGAGSVPDSLFLCHISTPPPEEQVCIRFATGGSLLYVDFGGTRGQAIRGRRLRGRGSALPRPQQSVSRKRAGIKGFSGKSRKRLLELLNSIDRSVATSERVLFVSLTYPGGYPRDPKVWRKHLAVLRSRLDRKWGPMAAFWKLEPQPRRGAPHWHLLLFVTLGLVAALEAFRKWLAITWYEACGCLDPEHLNRGTHVHPTRNWDQALNYPIRYIAKRCEPFVDTRTGEVLAVGRWWGAWHKDLLPVQWVEAQVPFQAGVQVRRVIRKWQRIQGGGLLTTVTAFVSEHTARRLIKWACGLGAS